MAKGAKDLIMRDSAALRRARSTLEIQDVYVRNFTANCAEGFNPKYDDEIEKLEVEERNNVTGFVVSEVEDYGRILELNVEVAIRLVRPNDDALIESKGTEDIEDEVCALIGAELIAEYLMSEALPEEVIEEYARKHCIYDVWPFWRELLASQCSRMELPRIVLPLHDSFDDSESDTDDGDQKP